MDILEKARALRPIIEQAAQSLDDSTALKAVELYPTWKIGTEYLIGTRIRYSGKLWRVRQDHIAQEHWTPEAAQSLFEEVNETHIGTVDDPIPYSRNMTLEEGLYYSEEGIVYLCMRDTENPVYNALSELVGIYVDMT